MLWEISKNQPFITTNYLLEIVVCYITNMYFMINISYGTNQILTIVLFLFAFNFALKVEFFFTN